MKLLIITSNFPYPLFAGGNVAQYHLIDYFRSRIDITLVCLFASEENYEELKVLWPNVDIRVYDIRKHFEINIKQKLIGYIKHPTRLIRLFFSWYSAIRSKFRGVERELWPDKSKMMFTSLNRPYLDGGFINYVSEISNHEHFDIHQVEFTPLISLANVLPSKAIKLFVHHEIAFVCAEREIATLINIDANDEFMVKISKGYELECLRKFDAIVTFSDSDKKTLEREVQLPIFVSPFSINDTDRINSNNFRLESLVYLGGEDHYPNKDAVEWFLNNCYPIIKMQFPTLKIKIIGKWSSNTIQKYKHLTNVLFLGFVENLYLELNNSAMIVPLRIGSGIRTKILEAFAMGVPVISSTIGIEGIVAKDKDHFFKADSITEYLYAIQTLTDNPSIAQRLINNAINDIVPTYKKENCAQQRSKIYNQLLNI